MWYNKIKDKREDYNILEMAKKSFLYFIYYFYNSLYNYSYIYKSYL